MSTMCTHCQLPVPEGLIAAEGPSFCCHGCELVYQMLHQHGAMKLYEQTMAERPAELQGEASAPSREEAYAYLARYARPVVGTDSAMEVELFVEGVHCAACVWLLEKLPSMCEGVLEARLSFRRSQLRLVWLPSQISLHRIGLLLDRMGYHPHPFRATQRQAMHDAQERKMLIRVGVAGAVAGNAMLLAFALYGGLFGGMSTAFQSFFRWTSLLVSLPAVLWAAWPFFRGAIAALTTRVLHMDLPIALGIFVGFSTSTWATVTGRGEIFFDSVTTLIFLLLVGRWLQHRQQRRASESTELLYQMAPAHARRIEGAAIAVVPVEQLAPGDVVEVWAGDVFPVDGIVRKGASRVDRSMLSGESRPVKVDVDDDVLAGCVNVTSTLRVEVTKTGEETRLGQLLTMVEEASRQRAPIVQMANRIAGVFVAVVLCLAVGTWLLWWWQGSSEALSHATALLIITCPCALGMATPLAISAALGQAARVGVLIKGGEVLEALASPGRLWLDKTGTLTRGEMSVQHWSGDATIKPFVRAIEQQCVHPIAQALVLHLPDFSCESDKPTGLPYVEQHLGSGLEADYDCSHWLIGAPDFVFSRSQVPDWCDDELWMMTARALTPVAIAVDGRVVALAGLGDALREGVEAGVARLQRAGWSIGILSGDHPDVVAAVGASLGLKASDCRGGLSPEEKRAIVLQERAAMEERTVVMVGDGVNDAPALATATVGIGVRGGAEAALSVADVYLSEEGAGALDRLIDGAHRTKQVILRNFAFSLAFNVVGVSLAVLGMLTPLIAAILMPLSSLTVISHSFRATTFATKAVKTQAQSAPASSASVASTNLPVSVGIATSSS